MMLSDLCPSVAYIGLNLRTERPTKTKIGTEVAHVTRDSDTTFKINRSKVKVTGVVHCGGLPQTLFITCIAALFPHCSQLDTISIPITSTTTIRPYLYKNIY